MLPPSRVSLRDRRRRFVELLGDAEESVLRPTLARFMHLNRAACSVRSGGTLGCAAVVRHEEEGALSVLTQPACALHEMFLLWDGYFPLQE
jgi:hypothetical protein